MVLWRQERPEEPCSISLALPKCWQKQDRPGRGQGRGWQSLLHSAPHMACPAWRPSSQGQVGSELLDLAPSSTSGLEEQILPDGHEGPPHLPQWGLGREHGTGSGVRGREALERARFSPRQALREVNVRKLGSHSSAFFFLHPGFKVPICSWVGVQRWDPSPRLTLSCVRWED